MLKTSGPLNSRTASLTERIADIDDARESLARRLDSLETRLRNQFTAMDALVSQLAATGSFLTQQLAGLSTSDG
jgi:flagellar hook-associated protein 2